MPLEWKRPDEPNDDLTEMIEALRAEYRGGTGHAEPRIIVEETSKGGPLHVYVIWTKWRDHSQRDRSEMIMSALEHEMKPDDLVRITIAMGLLPDEAGRYGIDLQP